MARHHTDDVCVRECAGAFAPVVERNTYDSKSACARRIPCHPLPMKDVADAHRQAHAVIAAIESVGATAHVPVERYVHQISGFAAVARCRALLLSVLILDDAGRADVIGVTLRALLEAWYFGVVATLGTDADIDKFDQDHRYWKNDLASHLPGVIPEPGPVNKFSVFKRAQRSDELLAEIGETPGGAVEQYKVLYAAESLTSAHASFESMKRYVIEGDDGVVGIVQESDADESSRYGRIRMAAVLTALLAKWVFKRGDLDATVFDRIDGLSEPDYSSETEGHRN